MRLVIDLQGAQSTSRWRGIGRYTRMLALEIARLGQDHDVLIVLNDAFEETITDLRRLFADLLPAENIRCWTAPGPTRAEDPDNRERRQRAEAIYEAYIASLQPDVLLITSLFEGQGDDVTVSVKRIGLNIPTAIILYDLIPLHAPERYLKPNPTWNQLYQDRLEALARADTLLAISDFTAQDARTRLPALANHKIVNISAACAETFAASTMPQEQRAALRERLGINRDFIMTSGTLDPNKNLISLFEAFTHLPDTHRAAHQIVLPGHADDGQRREWKKMAKKAGLARDELIVTGYVSDNELAALYSDAKLMVFPSIDEGFGLPPLEAMTCGTPTIGSNSSSIPEVIGLAEALFDPLDTKGLSNLMSRALCDPAFRKTLKDNAARQTRAFSCEAMGQRALDALVSLSEETKPASDCDPLQTCLTALAETAPQDSELNELARALAFDFPDPTRPRHLFVDISELHVRDAHTGCQRVTRSVLNEWLRNPPADVVVVPVYATSDREGYMHARNFAARLLGEAATGPDLPIDYASGDVFFGLDLHLTMPTVQRVALKRMQRRGVSVKFLIYDLLPMEMPAYFDAGLPPAFQIWLETVAQYDGIIGISKATTSAFQLWSTTQNSSGTSAPFTCHSVHLGADLDNSVPTKGMPKDAANVLAQVQAAPSFLMVGTLEPRKGHAQALDAFEQLWAEGTDVTLVIVGKEGWRISELAKRLRSHPERGRRLFWLEHISDEYLEEIYKAASCLLAASFGEGFGLPLIEAARAGIPILARNLPVFQEVAGEHAAYFEGETPENLAQSLRDWIKASKEDQVPKSADMPFFDWAECAGRMADVLLHPEAHPETSASTTIVQRIKGFTARPERIVVLKLDHMGDLLLALPAISRLKARNPDADLEIVVGSWNRSSAELLGLFDKIHTFDYFKRKSSEGPVKQKAALEAMAREVGHADIAIDLRRQPDTRAILTALSAELKVGYRTNIQSIDAQLDVALDHWDDIPFERTPLNNTHITQQMLALVDALPRAPEDFVTLPDLLPDRIHTVPGSVALFPKAGNSVKEWGDTNYLNLARRLAETPTIPVVNVYFATETEAKAAGFATEGKIVVHSGLSFDDMALSLAGNQVCVANNSLGAHIASYLGVHVVGIYGGHETAEEWAPIFGTNDVIQRPVPCSPCHLPSPEDCPHGLMCLDIPVSAVFDQVCTIIKTKNNSIAA